MHRQPAKVLEPEDVRLMLEHVRDQRHPERNHVMILLSCKAGLRACEIAGLTWPMVLDSSNQVGSAITVARAIAKCRSGRSIPMHRQLHRALAKLHKRERYPLTGPVVRSERASHMTAASVVNWFGRLYGELNMVGCSSHSGRRTFITASARLLAKTGGSLRDIQELAGHRALTTTERYIQGNRDAQRKLVALL
jgi:integrase/recombinase XerD